jgi:hypothetical protein
MDLFSCAFTLGNLIGLQLGKTFLIMSGCALKMSHNMLGPRM